MNKIILMGRLTRDPNVNYKTGADGDMCIARFNLAVDRQRRKGQEQEADFFSCTAFGKQGEFVEKYLKQGTKVLLTGRVQNDTYTNREGQKVYSVSVMVETMEFCESKSSERSNNAANAKQKTDADGFMNIPDGVDDDDLPFC